MADRAVVWYNMPVKWAYQAFSIRETRYRYKAKLNTENDEIADRLIRLTDNNRTGGSRLCCLYYATSKTLFGTTNVFIECTRHWS